MRKQVRQYLRRSLCGMLSAAMILTGSIIPDISVLAAQPAVEGTAENNDADVQVDETPSVENNDAVQNPDAADGNADGNIDSGEGDEIVPERPEENIPNEDDVTSPDANMVLGDDENDGDPEDDDTVDSNIKDDGVTGGVADDDKVEEASDEVTAVTADNNKSYTDQSVTLNYYVGDLDDGETVGFCPWPNVGGGIAVDEALELEWKAWTDKTTYEMKSVGNGWYNITFKVTDTLTIDDTGKCTNSLAGFNILKSSEPDKKDGIFGCDAWHASEIYVGLLDGTMTAVKDGEGYADIAAADGFSGEVKYTDKEVTLNYYVGDLGEGETVGFCPWSNNSGAITVDANLKLGWAAWDESKTVYEMKSVEGNKGWYKITFEVTDTLTMESGACTKSLAGFNILKSSAPNQEGGIFGCDAWHASDIYVDLLAGTVTAVKDGKGYADIAAAEADETAGDGKYENQSVTLNYYVGELATKDETIGFYKWSNTGGELTVDPEKNTLLSWGGWGNASKNPVYQMQPVAGYTGWYDITFTVTDTLTATSSLTGFSVFRSSSTGNQIFESSGFINPTIYAGLLSGKMTAVKDGKGYASIEEAVRAALEELVDKAKKLKQEDYKEAGWKDFSDALAEAEKVLEKESATYTEIDAAYKNLKKAMDALVSNSLVEAEINVKPIALADDFITGADISSYWALKESGTVFKDENGNELNEAFFKYLHEGGTNWIRIRVWNDPYDSEGHGYGGGNNDLEKAKEMGVLATDAGMRVLIDFHYSDFWADPGKQQAPKAWKDKTVDEKADLVYEFTLDSLNELRDAGVDVGMVQVGNETTNGICGVWYSSDGWEAAAKIYNAGSKAVREFDKDCLVAIHFTNPERSGNYASLAKSLNDQKVDYDVFASSYYPFWHGTTENLTSVLANVAKTYGKKVMVAETSWATTLDDQDGHENTVRKGNNDSGQPYAFSVQGQADEIRAVVEAANNVNSVEGAAGSSIGVFYWEPAWISPHDVYDDDGNVDKELLAKNQEAWETYGSGWASSYATDYDPDDAGKYFGGSAIDNQAWFGFDGAALPTAKIYSYIRTGAETEKAVSDVVNPSITIKAGETVEYPEKVTVKFNDGTSANYAVTWNEDDKAKVNTETPGEYEVNGKVTCEYTLSDGSTKTETKSVTLTITVKPNTVPELINPGFEDEDMSAWEITGSGTKQTTDDPHGGTYGVHFYNTSAVTSTVMQKIENLDVGTYVFGGYIQGDSAGTTAEVVANVYDREGKLKDTKTAPCTTAGWCEWQNPEVKGIVVGEGDSLEVGMKINAVAGGWGSIDDFYLYATEYGIVVDDQNERGTLSASAANSVAGETITITAAPKKDYILTKLIISGKGVKENTLTSGNGTVAYDEGTKSVVLTYANKVTGETTESFVMPNSMVKVSAVFRTDVDVAALDQLIAEYEKLKADGYTEESWKAFTDALTAAKAASENVDATQAEIDKAKADLETAYAGLEKAPEPGPGEEVDLTALNALIAQYESVTNDGYTKASWKTFTDALAAAKEAAKKENVTQAEVDSAKAALETAYAGLVKTPAREGLWAEWTDEWTELLSNDNTITYTGKAIKPTVKVYDGETLLTNNSYSVSYQNNTKVGEAGVIIKGKGNYTGSCTMKFNIAYVDLANDSDVSIANLYAAASKNGNPVSVKPVVTWKGKKVNAKLYDVVLPDKSEGAYVAPGTYNVEVKAKENNGIYKGSRAIKITLVDTSNDAQVLMSTVKVKFNFKSKTWTEGGVTLDPNDIKVTYRGTDLTLNTDYELAYENNDQIGTATVIITGTGTPTNGGKFVGELRKTFKIIGTPIKAKDVKLDTSVTMVYNGTDHKPAVQIDGLTKDKDYKVTYQNNINAGKKATAIITGINAYSGTIKKTFTIAAHDVNQADVIIEVNEGKTAAYEKGGSKPPVKVTFNGRALIPGTDYTVSYAKNTKVTEGATAEARITGKGNFTQKKTLPFAIGTQSLDKLKATAVDQTNAGKWNKVSPVITDLNGKALKKGTDYEKTFTYKLYDANNAEVTDTTATPPAVGMRVEVTAAGKGGYEGTITAEYRIIDSKQSIAKARITVTPQIYTGKAIELSKDAIKLELKDGSDWKLLSADQYEIVGYSNNINKGKAAKVTIHGLAPYGGTKTFKFEIKAQSMEGMSWAERIASMFERMFN